jgi:hypothetical protein
MTRTLAVLTALGLLFVSLAFAPTASAQSGADQYLEQIPDAEGDKRDGESADPGAVPEGGDTTSGDNASAAAPPDDDDGGGMSGVVIAIIAILVLVPIAFLLYRRFAGNGRGGEPEQV